MKILLKFSLLILSFASLVSCNNQNTSTSVTSSSTSGSTTSQSSSSSSSTSIPTPSQWNGDAYMCLMSYVGEEIPYLNGFNNSFAVGAVDASTKPYFNPYIENSSDYTNEYKTKLLNLGFTFDGINRDDGYDKYEYHRNDIYVSHAYYNSENKYWFDVYAFNDKDPQEVPSGYKAVITYNDFSKKYEDQNKTIGDYQIQSKYVMNSSSKIQFQKSNGSLVIKGNNISKIVVKFIQYPQSLIVKAGSSSSNLNVTFNNAGEYVLNNANYVELKTPTLGNNTARICTIDSIYIY